MKTTTLKEGLQGECTLRVTDAHTAAALGSGDLPVLATPILVARMEHAALMAVAPCLAEGETTVGGMISISHLAPTPVGASITATAMLERIEGRKLHFRVRAVQDGVLLGEGTHLRFIVQRERFLSRL